MIKPTVGRKVWYRPSRQDLTGPVPMNMMGNPDYNPQPLDATIVAVHGDRMINVVIFDTMGRQFAKLSVTLVQEGDTTPKTLDGKEAYGYAEWMPYQVGQTKAQALGATAPVTSGQPTRLAAQSLDDLRLARDVLVKTNNRYTTMGEGPNPIIVDIAALNEEFCARGLAGECAASPLELRNKSARL